jgi:NAD(P)-dependent dehydrogenase (short-subunit alcohol dehydrogenase family)
MPDKKFDNQVAIITGAGQGIGFEIARQLSLNGAAVILNDIDPYFANKAAVAITDMGGKCHPFTGDASDTDFIERMVREAVLKFGKLTIAIANAGITSFGDFFEFDAESLQKVMSLNLSGTFFLAQKAASQIKKQQSGGTLLFMSSVTGHQAHKNLAAYGMTKAGVEMLAKSLVVELSEYNISVNTIAPGATLTERTLLDKNYKAIWTALTPLGRPALVEDIANAVLFFVSPESRHVTGQCLIVDGGWSASSPSPY